MLGLVSVHPLDLGFRNDQSKLDTEWSSFKFRPRGKDFKINWFTPDEGDR